MPEHLLCVGPERGKLKDHLHTPWNSNVAGTIILTQLPTRSL